MYSHSVPPNPDYDEDEDDEELEEDEEEEKQSARDDNASAYEEHHAPVISIPLPQHDAEMNPP